MTCTESEWLELKAKERKLMNEKPAWYKIGELIYAIKQMEENENG